jgi:hypothetical protein
MTKIITPIAEYGRHHYVLMTSLPEEEIQKRFAEYGYGMVVADGIGGDGQGEAASRLALEKIMQLVLLFGKWHLRIDAPIGRGDHGPGGAVRAARRQHTGARQPGTAAAADADDSDRGVGRRRGSILLSRWPVAR